MRFLMAATLVLSGCALRPAGEEAERARAQEVERSYEQTPLLPDSPTLDDYLRYAFLANADLRARYWEWRSAIEQIPQDSSFPNVAVPFGFMFSAENMKAWDRTTLGAANDPMSNIPFPTKLSTAGRRALEEARAAGLRFEGVKFVLQGRVLAAYYDLALLAESLRIQEESVALLKEMARQAQARVETGGATQQDLLKAQTELELAQNDLDNLKSQVPSLVAMTNALLNRAPDAAVPLPKELPAARPVTISDSDLIRLGSERSPELSALARQVQGREEALSLARQAYIPDLGLSFSATGSISQTLGGMLILPFRLEAIHAGIEQARANLKTVQAAREQYTRNLAASFVLNLVVLRNDERQIGLFEKSIIPRARQTIQMAQTAYAAGRIGFIELLDAQRTLLDTRLALAQLKMEREKALAAIETWSVVDVEQMNPRMRANRALRAVQGSPSTGNPAPPAGSSSMGGMK